MATSCLEVVLSSCYPRLFLPTAFDNRLTLSLSRYIMEKVKDLQELVSLSQEELEEILGNDANAKLLWNFLHSELEVTPSSRSKSVRKL